MLEFSFPLQAKKGPGSTIFNQLRVAFETWCEGVVGPDAH